MKKIVYIADEEILSVPIEECQEIILTQFDKHSRF